MKTLHLEISNACNEHCVHCYRHSKNCEKIFLSLETAENVLLQARKLGAETVVITGGESLLNPNWKEIIKFANKLEYKILLFTNGMLLTESDAEFLTDIKNLKSVQISLYSLCSEDHDSITGVKGSCEKTKKAVELLKNKKVPVFLTIMVMKENMNSFLEVIRWANQNNISNCPDFWLYEQSDYKKENIKHRVTESEIDQIFNRTMTDYKDLSYIWGKGQGNRNLSEIDFYGTAVSSLCITADENIYPMIGWYEKLGNIKCSSLKEIYENNSILNAIRKIKVSDIKQCLKCDASDFCVFCPTSHITANKGKLKKLDKNLCHFVNKIKSLSKKRDEIIK